MYGTQDEKQKQSKNTAQYVLDNIIRRNNLNKTCAFFVGIEITLFKL